MHLQIKQYLAYVFFVTLSLGLISCDDDDEPGEDLDQPESISQTIADAPDFMILSEALNRAGLQDMLDSDSSSTLLAPPDYAFIAAGIDNLDDYTPEQLKQILQYHLLDTEVTYADLDTGAIQTLNGPVDISVFADQVFLNGEAEFLQINVDATNGVIHTIDEVLLPPEEKITTLLDDEENLSTLRAALQRTGLDNTLAGQGPYTLFAPTNSAFDLLLENMNMNSIDEVPVDSLTKILQFHIANGQAFSTELPFRNVKTIEGEEFGVTFTDRIVLVDQNPDSENAVLVSDNLLGTNGIVHKIDRVLRP